MKTNVILTYNGLSDGLLTRNDGDHQTIIDVCCVVKSTDTEKQVWDKIVKQIFRRMDADFIPYVCKISTASNWMVWEELTGNIFNPHFDGKFFFGREDMNVREKEYETLYGFGTAEDCWVEPPTAEEKEHLAKWSMIAQLNQLMKKVESGEYTEQEKDIADSIEKSGSVKQFVDAIEQKYGSISKSLEAWKQQTQVHGNA